MRTPTFIDVNTATSSTSVTSINITVPITATVGNLLVLVALKRFNDVGPTHLFDTPSGWTLGMQNNNNGVEDIACWYRICQSGDPGSTVTIIDDGGAESDLPSAACLVYSNIYQTAPVFTSIFNYDPGTSTSWGGGALDCRGSTRTCMGVMMWGSFRNGSPLTVPSTVNARVNINSLSSRFLVIADELLPPGDLQPTRSVTATNPQTYVGLSFAFSGDPAMDVTDDTGSTDLIGTDLITPILVGSLTNTRKRFSPGTVS